MHWFLSVFVLQLVKAISPLLPAAQVFDIQFSCTGLVGQECELAEAVFRESAIRVASQLLIQRQIRILAKVIPVVSSRRWHDLGWALPKIYAARREGGSLMMYPKAVLKQSIVEIPEVMAGYDMEIVFNSHAEWNIIAGEEADVDSHQVSFYYYSMQQIVRGLGLVTGLHMYSRGLLTPAITTTRTKKTYYNPPSVFDALINRENSSGSFYNFIANISRAPPLTMSKLQYHKQSLLSTSVSAAAARLHHMATNNNASVISGNVELHAVQPFGPLSLSHFSLKYEGTEKMLMVPFHPGLNFKYLHDNLNPGDFVLDKFAKTVLRFLGYPMSRPYDSYPKFTLSTTHGTDLYDPLDVSENLEQKW